MCGCARERERVLVCMVDLNIIQDLSLSKWITGIVMIRPNIQMNELTLFYGGVANFL